jgi:hypothetical protein
MTMALVSNRRDEFSEKDLMDFVRTALRESGTTSGESALTQEMLKRGFAELAPSEQPKVVASVPPTPVVA